MELLRALGAVVEKPDAAVTRLAAMLELPAQPTAAEWTFLFEHQLPPVASRYLSADGEDSPPIYERMATYWRAAGASPPSRPDHLGQLLGFYADLVDMQAHEGDEARRHAVGRLRKTVLWDHLLTWLPGYLTKVDLIAPRAYRRWGQLVWQVAAREAWTVGAPAAAPAFLAALRALPGPAHGDVAGLVAHLAAPARSGLILAPVDLNRAADAVHTSLPDGPVREALSALVAAREAGMIEWLATETRRWEARHERNCDLLPALSDHWTRRAHTTRVALQAWTRASTPASTTTAGRGAGAAGRTRASRRPPALARHHGDHTKGLP